MPSITSWTRLEPRSRSEEIVTGLQAQVHDPLWLLARQWQLGEFQGEDAGSPAAARLHSPLTRFYPGRWSSGAAAQGQGYDISQVSLPLEALVEREAVRSTKNWWLAAEAGLHFFRLLTDNGIEKYRSAYVARYPLAATVEERRAFDRDTLAFLEVMAPRVPNGDRLYEELLRALRPPSDKASMLPPQPAIDEADRFGAIDAGPEDLARMLLMEFALICDNDWYAIPVEVPVSVVCRIRSLVVSDTFGQRILIRPFSAVDTAESSWRMFQLSPHRGAESGTQPIPTDLFFLPPALAPGLESAPVEEVLFL
jgi:hypothetical protein